MVRRALVSAAAAAALVLVPTAALAYEAPGYDIAVEDVSPSPGEGFQVSIDGATVGEDYTLTITSSPASLPDDVIQIAGTASLTRTATSPTVSWTVTLQSAGTFALAVTNAAGELVADSTVVVTAAGEDDVTGGDGLAVTGFDGVQLAIGAGVLLVLGAGAVVVSRRRQKTVERV